MRRHDRLALLAACHNVHRQYGIGSIEAHRLATREQLSRLSPRYLGIIRDLNQAGHPDILLALWPPRDVTWLVAGLTVDPTARLLSVSRGPHGGASTTLLSVAYDVRDADADRRVWRALRAALRDAKGGPT